MGRMYAVTFSAVGVTVAQDLFELVAPSTAAVVLHSIHVGQSSDAADAQDEQLRIRVIRGYTSSGSGGSSATPAALLPGDAASGATAEVNNTTVASGGSPVTLYEDAFNVRAGFVWTPTPECRPVVAPSGRIVVNLPAAPADSLTMSGTLVFEEIG